MRELVNDFFYEVIAAYKDCIIDYCLIEADIPHQGKRSHKDALLFAMLKVIERYINTQIKAEIEYCRKVEDEPFPWYLDIGKAQAHQIDASTLLHIPKILRTDHVGRRIYDCELSASLKSGQIPYWYAFWETPHASGYGPDDFIKVNSALFPRGTEELEIYEWSTDWSNYFDGGHEWFGTVCRSIYDKCMNRYIVIMASATD